MGRRETTVGRPRIVEGRGVMCGFSSLSSPCLELERALKMPVPETR
jgi:hypothetical protein